MKTILVIIVLIIAYGILNFVYSFVFGRVRFAFKRRKIAKLGRLDRMDNGDRLKTYFLELGQIRQAILDKWPGQFPPGEQGKMVQELSIDRMMCIRQNPRLISAAAKKGETERA